MPGVSAPVALIGIAEKGYLTLQLEASGPEGHTSFPPDDTAVSRLVHALRRLEERPMPPHLTRPVAAMFEALAPHASGISAFCAPSPAPGRGARSRGCRRRDDSYRFTPVPLRPDDVRRVHGIDERLDIDAYARAIRFYASTLPRAGSP